MNFRSLIIASLLFAASGVYSQMDYHDSNKIGIFGGISSFDLNTSDFKASAETGWTVGAGIRGNFYNNFDMIYTVAFFENAYSASIGAVPGFSTQDLKYKIQGVQITLMPSYNLIYNHLSIEAGPVFQVNGKAKYAKDFENYYVHDLPFTVKDMANVNTFSFLGAVGATAGIREVRLNVKYMYSFSNFLGKTNDKLDADFTSHPNTLVGTLTVYF